MRLYASVIARVENNIQNDRSARSTAFDSHHAAIGAGVNRRACHEILKWHRI